MSAGSPPHRSALVEQRQQPSFLGSHASSLRAAVHVIVTQEMQDAVHQQPTHFRVETSARPRSLSRGSIEADDHVTQRDAYPLRALPLYLREGQHIGGPVFTSPHAVERSDLVVAGQNDGEIWIRIAQGVADCPGAPANLGGWYSRQASSVSDRYRHSTSSCHPPARRAAPDTQPADGRSR